MTLSKSELNYSDEEILKLKIALTKGWDEELKTIAINEFLSVDSYVRAEILISLSKKLTEEDLFQSGILIARNFKMRFDDPEFGRF